MALYLGNEKIKINLSNTKLNLQFYSSILVANGTLLKSSDNFTLKDSDGLYITTKEE